LAMSDARPHLHPSTRDLHLDAPSHLDLRCMPAFSPWFPAVYHHTTAAPKLLIARFLDSRFSICLASSTVRHTQCLPAVAYLDWTETARPPPRPPSLGSGYEPVCHLQASNGVTSSAETYIKLAALLSKALFRDYAFPALCLSFLIPLRQPPSQTSIPSGTLSNTCPL